MHTVLIVDDSDINLTLIKALVLKLGDCTPVLFDNPVARRWSGAVTNVPDLVIVDYMMPDMDGLQFISAFRALHGRNEIPVLMITANDQKDVRYDALLGGANDFLTKPIDRIEFSARARNMLSLRTGSEISGRPCPASEALVEERTSRDSRARKGADFSHVARRRVSRPGNRRPYPAHGALFANHRPRPGS
jgi:DNA-binding response OmpR family regulator